MLTERVLLPAMLKIDNPGTLHDVTHLPCRSARYTPLAAAGSEAIGSPANVKAGERARTSRLLPHCS
jgi:hypothetical protein